jgi:hypothetical protein
VGKSKYFFNNITLLNVILLLVIIFIADYTLFPVLNINLKYELIPREKKAVEHKEVITAEHALPSLADYVIVGDQNLFHPDRKIPPEKKVEPASLPKPDLLLYGTLISNGDLAVAYVEDMKSPRNTPGRGERQLTLKKGDILSGFVLKDIEAGKIVLARGEEEMVVPVMDRRERKKATVSVTQPSQSKDSQIRSLFKPEPLPQKRARMTRADERSRAFFTK